MQTEKLGTSNLNRLLSRSNLLEPDITENDKGLSWDGHINVFKNSKKWQTKDNLLFKIPVQVKGHLKTAKGKDEKRYNIDISDLNNYRTIGGTLFFKICMDQDGTNERFYYRALLPGDISIILGNSRGEKTTIITLEPFPIDICEIEKILTVFAEAMRSHTQDSSICWDDYWPQRQSNSTTQKDLKNMKKMQSFFLFNAFCRKRTLIISIALMALISVVVGICILFNPSIHISNLNAELISDSNSQDGIYINVNEDFVGKDLEFVRANLTISFLRKGKLESASLFYRYNSNLDEKEWIHPNEDLRTNNPFIGISREQTITFNINYKGFQGDNKLAYLVFYNEKGDIQQIFCLLIYRDVDNRNRFLVECRSQEEIQKIVPYHYTGKMPEEDMDVAFGSLWDSIEKDLVEIYTYPMK